MVNMLWIGRAININTDIGCWNQSALLAEVKTLKAASSYATFFYAAGMALSTFLFHQNMDVASNRGYKRLRQQTGGMRGYILPLA